MIGTVKSTGVDAVLIKRQLPCGYRWIIFLLCGIFWVK